METWYVMEDGSAGDPAEIGFGADGKLAHKDGRKVAYRPDGITPRSRGVDADAERAKAEKPKPTVTRELTAEKPKRGYKTRESKAD